MYNHAKIYVFCVILLCVVHRHFVATKIKLRLKRKKRKNVHSMAKTLISNISDNGQEVS